MDAERLILETNHAGKIKKLPKLPPNKKLEAIFLIVDDIALRPIRRTPHADITGKTKFKGDLIDTVPATDWEFSS
ncbi:hypothetical protein VU04_08865 [Desulfobulbus sp. TB]|nr:hypothetical protein [Desulfobulbus sp. TB]